MTKVLGNHTLKGGIFVNYQGENDNDQINVATVPGGANNKTDRSCLPIIAAALNGTTGAGIANLALGLADSYTEIGPRAYTSWTGQMYEEFVQDSWKVTPRLHIDYGIRVTSLTPYKPAWGNAAYFDPASYDKSQVPVVSPTTGNITLGTGNAYNGVVIRALASSRVPQPLTVWLDRGRIRLPVRAVLAMPCLLHTSIKAT